MSVLTVQMFTICIQHCASTMHPRDELLVSCRWATAIRRAFRLRNGP